MTQHVQNMAFSAFTLAEPWAIRGGKRGEVGGEIPLACLPLHLLTPFPPYLSCQVLGDSYLVGATSPSSTSGLFQMDVVPPPSRRWKARSRLLVLNPMDFSVFLTLPITRFSLELPSPEISLLSLFRFSSYLLCFISVSSERFSFSAYLFMKISLPGFHLGFSPLTVSHSLLLSFTFQRLPKWGLYSRPLSTESGNASDSSVSPSIHTACINGALIYPCPHPVSPLSPLWHLLCYSPFNSLSWSCVKYFSFQY